MRRHYPVVDAMDAKRSSSPPGMIAQRGSRGVLLALVCSVLFGCASGDTPDDVPLGPGSSGPAAAGPSDGAGRAGVGAAAAEPSASATAGTVSLGTVGTEVAEAPSAGDGERPGVVTAAGPAGVPLCLSEEAALPQVPAAFAQHCAGCHAATPGVMSGYPDLFQRERDLASISAQVRSGGGGMPAFTSTQVSAAELEGIASFLQHSHGALSPCKDAQTRCAAPSVTALFAPSEVPAIVTTHDDGTLVTRGAGRVRGRHELEGSYSLFGPHYFENRSYEFTIEDTVAAGGSTVTITYRPEADASEFGPTTNLRFWKVLGDGNVFHMNVGLEVHDLRHQTYVVTRNAREGRPMKVGDVLDFEFGIFIAGNNGADPGAIEGRTAYYTDTFRYRVGVGGLSAENRDPSGALGPQPEGLLTGDTTVPFIYAEPEMAFSQMALNMQPEHVQPFLRGRRLFHTDFGDGSHSEAGNPVFAAMAGKLGPMDNAHGCVDCHERDGRGALPDIGMPLATMATKLYGPAALGNQLQRKEGTVVRGPDETSTVMHADGTEVTLSRPSFEVDSDRDGLQPSIRIARQLPGMGLLEAIDEETLLARADAGDCDGDGISGRAQLITLPGQGEAQLGRFGWRAEKVSVAHQVADALEADMGVTSPLLPGADGASELSADVFADLVMYTRLLSMPGRKAADERMAQAGEAIFARVGCDRCHISTVETGDRHPLPELRAQRIHPYTDLLLHDMGEALADDSGTEFASEWRTPPLWGLGRIESVSGKLNLLHDGRANSPLEAILWHGGEAAFAREAVIRLSTEDRQALLAFLSSL